MRIVAHNGSRTLGGGETGTARLLHSLQARGHDVVMLCSDVDMAAKVSAFAAIPTAVQHIGGAAMLPDAARFALRLREERADAVLLTSFKKVWLAGLGARMAGVRTVVQRIVLERDTPARGLHYRLAFRHFVDAVTLNANQMRAAFLAADPGLDPGRVHTLYDGPQTPVRLRPHGAVRAELGIPQDAHVIGAVARLVRQKRFDRMVDLLAAMPADVHCLIAGDGEERAVLEARATSLGVRARLHLPGFQTGVGDVLDALDVFVLTSEREGMANAMLEAMAFGLPVVSTRVSGAAEALDAFADGSKPGVICDHELSSLVRALHDVLDDPEGRLAMGRAAQRRVNERFSEDEFVDRYERLLSGEPVSG
jgi:glycosyltransferase involved in cell wall biosynthesis